VVIGWLVLVRVALAETGSVLPAGALVGYTGVGVSTFATGAGPQLRDRQLRSRLDLYGAWGLGRRLQVSVDAPVVYNAVIPIGSRGPCPGEGDWCAPVFTVGEAGVHARFGALSGPVRVVLGAGVRGDPWNVATRDRWTNAGLGTTSAVGSLVVEPALPAGGLLAYAHYGRVLTRAPGAEVPGDVIAGGVEGRGTVDAVTVEVGLSGLARMGGVAYGDAWLDAWYDSPDRWAALNYREMKARVKVSVALCDRAGLHVSAGRVLVVANGPRDATDVAIGVHTYAP
jgi:hypothetical protein